MKYEDIATHADALTLSEMKVRCKNNGGSTADYNGVSMDYVMEPDGVRVVGFIAPTHVNNEELWEAFYVLADMVNVDKVYHGHDVHEIKWVKHKPSKPFPEYVQKKPNYFKEVGFILMVLAVLSLPFLAAGYNEMKFKQKLAVQTEWYNAHPDANILIFNCINDKMEVKCPNGAEKRFEK